MTLKYLGMILIVLSSTLIGSRLAISEKRRIERSEALCELVHFIYREIECFRTPLDDIYMRFSSPVLDNCGFMSDTREKSLKYALENMKDSLSYREQTVSEIISFADGLGKSEYQDQIARCKYTLSSMDADLKKAKEEYPKNRKMYTSLGLLSGLMIIILMI